MVEAIKDVSYTEKMRPVYFPPVNELLIARHYFEFSDFSAGSVKKKHICDITAWSIISRGRFLFIIPSP